MVQLILEAAQGASAGLYPDTFHQTERCDLPEGAHPIGTDGFVAGAAFAALARASAQPSAAALLTPKNPFCHCIILILKWYNSLKFIAFPRWFPQRLEILGICSLIALLGFGKVDATADGVQTIEIGYILPGDARAECGEAMGAQLGLEEVNVLAGFFAKRFVLLSERSNGPEQASTVAEKLIERENLVALIGAVDDRSSHRIGRIAKEHRIPFFNCGSSSDALRNELCDRYTFHLEATRSMYVAAVSRWLIYQRRSLRWYFLTSDSSIDRALYSAANSYLEENGGVEIGHRVVSRGKNDFSAEFEDITSKSPQVVFLTLQAEEFANFLRQSQHRGFTLPIVHPSFDRAALDPEAVQTVPFAYPSLWHHGLFRYSARELNSRFRKKFDRPMDSRAWVNWAAVKMIGEAVVRSNAVDGPTLVEYLESEPAFDGHKGESLTFRKWNHQLRQPIYILATAEDPESDSHQTFEMTAQIPIAGPRSESDPVDSIGISQSDTGCAFESL